MNAKKYYETSNETIQELKNKTGQLDTDIGLLKKKATLEAKQELIKKEKEALKANIKEIYSSHIQTRNYFGQFKRF